MRKQMKMILKGKVSDLNNNVVPIIATTESSNIHNESNACATNENIVECVPGSKLGE